MNIRMRLDLIRPGRAALEAAGSRVSLH